MRALRVGDPIGQWFMWFEPRNGHGRWITYAEYKLIFWGR